MTTDKPKTTRERIERMRERVAAYRRMYVTIDLEWSQSLAQLIDAQTSAVHNVGHVDGGECQEVLLSALEAAVDDLCGEGR